MVVGRAFCWTNGATRFYKHAAMFSTTRHLFLGLRGVEFSIQIFWHIRENCRFCILGHMPFPTILQNSELHTENFVLLTYIFKNKAQTQIFEFSNLYKPLSISSANCMDVIAMSGSPDYQWYISVTSRSRFAGKVAPAFTESKSIPFHTRFAGRVAPAFTESKSIHFHTNLSGASRNNSVGYWCNGTNLAYILPKICIISL